MKDKLHQPPNRENSHKRPHSEGNNEAIGHRTKKELIILMKKNNPTLNLKEIGLQCGTSYGYARKVWSEFIRAEVTGKGYTSRALGDVVLPFRVHGFVWTQEVPSHFYDECPLKVSDNPNRQKVFSVKTFSFVIYPKGNIRVYRRVKDDIWREHLRNWLNSWLAEIWVNEIVDNLVVSPELHLAAPAPDTPLNFKLNISGLGRFGFDRTPFKDGTIEYEMDPGFSKHLENLEKNQIQILQILKRELLLKDNKVGKMT